MKISLEWTTIELLNTQEFALIFYNNALKSKAVTGNNRRRIFSFLVPLSSCRCSSAMTCTFVQADTSTASVSHLHCSLSSGMHCTWNLAEGSTYPSLSYQGPTNIILARARPVSTGYLHDDYWDQNPLGFCFLERKLGLLSLKVRWDYQI